MSGNLSVQVVWRRELLKSNAPQVPKLVGVTLNQRVNSTTWEAWPSAHTLAKGRPKLFPEKPVQEHTSLSERAVWKGLAWLLDNGWLEKVFARDGLPTIFRLRFPADVLVRVAPELRGRHLVPGGLHDVRRGLHDVREGSAPDADKLGLEQQQELDREPGHVQLGLERDRLRLAGAEAEQPAAAEARQSEPSRYEQLVEEARRRIEGGAA